MSAQQAAVKGSIGAERDLNPYLALSAVADVSQQAEGGRAAPELAPAEALVRDERDPFVWTETELRLAWGDR